MAIDADDEGLDFADALHVAQAGACATLVSFDKKFFEPATGMGLRPRVERAAC